MSALLAIGNLGRPHGLRGEISLHLFNAESDLAAVELPLELELVRGDVHKTVTVIELRPAQRAWLAQFRGFQDRDAVASLTGYEVRIRRDALPPLAEGESYVEDLLGCEVHDTAGRARGTVRGSFWNGAHDVLTIIDAAGTEWLVPAVPEFLVTIDLEARRLVVDPHEEDDAASTGQ